MTSACPTCGTQYNVSRSNIGSEFTCKKCGSQLAVTKTGLAHADADVEAVVEAVPVQPRRRPASRTAVGSTGGIGDFLAFRTMIVPTIIQVLFWLGVAATVIIGILTIVVSLSAPRGTLVGVLMGLGYCILGPLAVRIYCELLIIAFRIHDTLGEIRDSLRRRSD